MSADRTGSPESEGRAEADEDAAKTAIAAHAVAIATEVLEYLFIDGLQGLMTLAQGSRRVIPLP
jgi:hypothetical protein